MATGEYNDYVDKDKGEIGLLFVEPKNFCSKSPIIDSLTRKMTAAFRTATHPNACMGWHDADCGAESDAYFHLIDDKFQTNSLCIHYLAFHRDEIPQCELDKVASLTHGEQEPTEEELQPIDELDRPKPQKKQTPEEEAAEEERYQRLMDSFKLKL